MNVFFAKDAIFYGGSPLPSDQIYARDIRMIQDADLVIAEVTTPSLGVGYELAYAQNLERPILCLFNTDSSNRLSAMVGGNGYNTIVEYTDDALPIDAIATFVSRT